MDCVTLLGAEEVANAGRNMKEAAEKMSMAASSIDESLRLHRQYMDTWIIRLEDAFTILGNKL